MSPAQGNAQSQLHINTPVPDANDYYPLNEPAIGEAYPTDVYPPNNKNLPKLFQPLTIKDVTFKNRIWAAPMCQYSSRDGHATDWHLVHLGGFATRGIGAIIIEATSVTPEGRISPEDAGLWTDTQIEPLKRIVDFVHAQGTKIGIQLAHAGRKASTYAPWVDSDIAHRRSTPSSTASKEENGWPDEVYGPSDLPFSNDYPKPKPLTVEGMQRLEQAYVDAVRRCKEIGFDFIEGYFAHGYLMHSFLSPLSNTRTDEFGGQSLENRMRYPLQIARRLRAEWPEEKPLFIRLSAIDWAEGPEQGEDGQWKQWGLEQTKIFVGKLKEIGVDLIDTSSGGNWSAAKFGKLTPGYQVPFAEAIKKAHPDIAVGTVGLIVDPRQAEGYLQEGKADVVLLARELLRRVDFPLIAALELGAAVKPANQYERAWTRMFSKENYRMVAVEDSRSKM